MVERSVEQNNLIFDGDPFSQDFRKNLNKAIMQEAGETALKGSAKVVACALPFTLSACSHSPAEILHNSLSDPNNVGRILGTLLAVEEAFERDNDKNFFQRGLSIGFKYLAGYGIGYNVIHNNQSGSSWLSNENFPQTITTFGLAGYVIVNETSIKRFLGGVGSSVKNARSAFSEGRKQADMEREVRHLADDAFSSNIPTLNAAREKAKQMGISLKQLKQIHDHKD